MKYLVTGATGAIGSGVVRQLAVEGKEIRAFVRDADKFHRLLPDVPAGVVTGDVLNPADVRRAVAGVDVVFHCVNFPLTRYERTLEAVQVLVEAARPQKPHIVFPGNSWVFGKPARLPITPDTSFNPPSRIARIKAQVDEMLMGSGLPVTVVHLPDFYGPNVVNPMVKPLFENALVGKDTSFPAPVDVPHQFVYVDDAARALIAVAGQDKCYGKRYTVGGIQPVAVRRFAEMIYREAGTRGRVRGMPFWLLRLLGLFSAEARAGAGMMHTFAWDVSMDGTAIRRDAGFTPRVGYEEGIRRTLAWFRAT
ncbi:MAG: NAD-dependent epimerase/dehydratase family protein [Anaerolineae bacterium]|nr:NAD-dependent epimerase/dehydratase family protein [Anaerolineae bacterium]